MNEKLLKVPDVAEYLGFREMTVYAMIRKGQLNAVRIGKRAVRVPESEIARFIEKGRGVQA